MEIYKESNSPASKEFEKLLDNQISKTKNLVEGKIIEGTVTKIGEKYIFLFIEGLKSEPVVDINELKIILANEATTMLHGKIAAVKAAETAKKTFTSGSFGDDLPVVKIKREKFESGLNIVDLVVESKLLNSKSEVRRMIKNLGIKVNNKTIESDKITVLLSEFNNSVLKLSQGKKKHILIKLTP